MSKRARAGSPIGHWRQLPVEDRNDLERSLLDEAHDLERDASHERGGARDEMRRQARTNRLAVRVLRVLAHPEPKPAVTTKKVPTVEVIVRGMK